MKLSHERKVRSFAKKTLGSTRVGRAIRLPVKGFCEYEWDLPLRDRELTWSCLEERLARHY